MATWDSVEPGKSIHLGVLTVDVVGNRNLTADDRALYEAKALLNRHVEAIANAHGGRLLSWAGDGGAFMFRMDGRGTPDNLVLAAQYVLSILPAFNAEVSVRCGLHQAFRLRVCCDGGNVLYDPDPGKIHGQFLNNLLGQEKQVGQPNAVVITERIHRSLATSLRAMFRQLRRCEPLQSMLFVYSPYNLKRRDSAVTLERLLMEAQNGGEEFCVCGVANTEFFGAGGRLNQPLRDALHAGMKARFLFLDPHSASAARRRIFELRRLDAIGEIETCLGTATNVRAEFPDSLRVRLAEEMPAFMCLNGREAMIHPYLSSVSGHDTTTWLCDGDAHTYAREHFDKLWGERWLLFDLGNVLVRFTHDRVSHGLLKHLRSSGSKRKVRREEFHAFIFNPGGGDSRSSELDRGERDLSWLRLELRAKFRIAIDDHQLRRIWCSVFDEPDRDALACLARMTALGVKVAICSNTDRAHWQHLSNAYPELADPQIKRFLSFEIGRLKGDRDFFRQVVEQTQSPFEHHLLIDDLEGNVLAARAAGMHVALTRGPVHFNVVQRVLRERFFI